MLTYDASPRDKDLGPTILIVDDEEMGRLPLEEVCKKLDKPYRVISCSNLKDAFIHLSKTTVHLVLLDKNLNSENPEEDTGIDNIPEMLRIQPHLQIIVVTGSNAPKDIVQAMRYGAFSYITKDSDSSLKLEQIKKALRVSILTLKEIQSSTQREDEDDFDLVGNSIAIRKVLSQIAVAAESDRPVLLLGETGTGKTTIAKYIHEYRKRFLKQSNRPFCNVSLVALSPSVIERDLFGNEQGAFTGANRMQVGFFEKANNGTLFLDEIGEITPETQAKLLTAIESGTFCRVGGTREIHSNFKLICATNRNLEQMIESGDFREDLYMRISTFIIQVPSLEERKEDIPEIIKGLMKRSCKENRVNICFDDIPKDFIEYVTKNPPIGNIRGIEQLLSRLVAGAPKDKSGLPILKKWKQIPGVMLDKLKARPKNAINLNEIVKAPFDVLGSDFPGMKDFMKLVERKLYQEAHLKFRRNKDIALALKVSEAESCKNIKEFRNGVSNGKLSN